MSHRITFLVAMLFLTAYLFFAYAILKDLQTVRPNVLKIMQRGAV